MRATAILIVTFALASCESTGLLEDMLEAASQNDTLSNETIAAGLREALTVGSGRVVDTLGREGGFSASNLFRIPLPDKLQEAQTFAGRFGLSKPFDDLELKMNEAAEAATPRARTLFVDAIRQMSFADVMSIYRGPDDAATQYLKRTTGSRLTSDMRPIIDSSLSEVGAVTTFNDLAARYNALPLVKPIDADLSGHVLDYASNAVFSQLAAEEAAIRKEPIKRTTELLRRVFGGSS